MNRKIWGEVILILLATLAALAIAEAGMRWLGFKPNPFSVNSSLTGDTKYTFARPDPEIGWVNKPGTPLSAEFGNEKMTILEDGQRLNASAGLKKSPEQRAIVVGGSFTMGYGVKDDETYPYLLDARYPSVEFENYGSGGYGTIQSFMMLKRVFNARNRKPPKLVIYGYFYHHKDRNVVSDQWAFALTDSHGRTANPPHALLENGSLVYYPYSVVSAWPLEQHSALVTELHKRTRIWMLRQRAAQRGPVTLRVLSDMNEYVKSRGSKFLVVALYPTDFYVSDHPVDDSLIGLMNANGIDSVTCKHPEWDKFLKDRQAGKRDSSLFINGRGHPSSKLHKYWANCISGYIDEKKLLQ